MSPTPSPTYDLGTMILPPGYRSSPATPADLDAAVALLEAWDRADGERIAPVREHEVEFYEASWTDLARDTLMVHEPDGQLAALVQMESIDPTAGIDAFVKVHPAHRNLGLGSACRRWSEAAAAARITAGTSARLWNATTSTDRAGLALLERAGYRHVRTFWHMHRLLAGLDEPGPLPGGVTIAVSRAGTDDQVVHGLTEASFSDHFGWQPLDLAQWRIDVAGSSTYDPALVLIGSVDGEPAGVLQAREMAGPAYIDIVGVAPAHRGKGIATALLWRSFADLANRGSDAVMLNVDSQNETGATRLYERMGMAVYREWFLMQTLVEGTAPAG